MHRRTTTLLGDTEPENRRHTQPFDPTESTGGHGWPRAATRCPAAPPATTTVAHPSLPAVPAPLPVREHGEHRPTAHMVRSNDQAAADLITDRLATLGASTPIVIAMIDIDHVGDINATDGLAIGDEVVGIIAERITNAVRPDDLVIRVGADRFVIMRSDIGRDIGAARFIDRIRRATLGRLAIAGRRIPVSAGIGFAIDRPSVFDEQRLARQRAIEVLTHTHEALRDAKHRGPGHVVRHHAPSRTIAPDDRSNSRYGPAELSAALRRGEMSVDYQPVFCPGSGDTLGAKALVRWQHPTEGVLEAGEFMSAAPADHNIALGDWVLSEAFAATRQWLDARVVADDFAIHVDIVGIDIGEPTFVDRVASMLTDHGLRPHRLVLEVNEQHLALRDSNGVSSAIRDLRRKGVGIAIDNFRMGSGAQSLATTVGADILRLDTSGTLTNGDDNDTNLAQSLVTLAHGLGMKVVAEGVKGADQLRRLRTAGCDLVHGVLLTNAA